MNIRIRKYDHTQDYNELLEVIKSEGEEWKDYLNPKYQINLQKSITYVAIYDEKLCGYSRSVNDHDFFIWVIDLLVDKNYRGHSVGRKLMECISLDFPDRDIYVMSDVDEYYEKLGYQKQGSIYKVE